jgi:hypothetical protein
MSQNYAKPIVRDISQNGQKTAQSLPKFNQGSFWERIIPRWENLIVSGREVKGIVVSPGMAAVVLSFILGLSATIYWRLSDQMAVQHDLIIELRTSLKDKEESTAEYRKKTNDEIALLKVYIDNLREKQIASDARKGKN